MKLSMKKNKGSTSIYRRQDGFTLLELLVVISLMALLSFIVLASLDNARAKGRDAQIQLQASSLRAQAERYYNAHGAYININDSVNDNVCVSNPTNLGFSGFPFDLNGLVVNSSGLLRDIQDTVYMDNKLYVKIDSPGSWNQVTCHASTNNWAVEIPMSDSTSINPRMYCIDGTGEYYKSTMLQMNDTDCNGGRN